MEKEITDKTKLGTGEEKVKTKPSHDGLKTPEQPGSLNLEQRKDSDEKPVGLSSPVDSSDKSRSVSLSSQGSRTVSLNSPPVDIVVEQEDDINPPTMVFEGAAVDEDERRPPQYGCYLVPDGQTWEYRRHSASCADEHKSAQVAGLLEVPQVVSMIPDYIVIL